MKKNLLLFLMVFFVCNAFGQENNPSEAYAAAMGYRYKTKTDSVGNQYGVTVLPNGKEVNAWDFFRGKVEPKYSYCAKKGYLIKAQVQKHNGYKTECAVCYQNLKKKSTSKLNTVSAAGSEQDSIVEIPMQDLMAKDGIPLTLTIITPLTMLVNLYSIREVPVLQL